MPDVIPPAVQDGLDRIVERLEHDQPKKIQAAMERILEQIERYLTIREAMDYILCRRNGGSMEECLGIYRAGSANSR